MRGNESDVSKYELSDALVANVVGKAELGQVEAHLIAALISDLKPQIPIPVPTKIGAVVRTTEPNYVYVRWTLDDSGTPWVDSQDDEHRSTERIGRIVEVLSEGVDL